MAELSLAFALRVVKGVSLQPAVCDFPGRLLCSGVACDSHSQGTLIKLG